MDIKNIEINAPGTTSSKVLSILANGGALYIDPVFPDYDIKALVSSDAKTAFAQEISCDIPPSNPVITMVCFDLKKIK